MKNGEVVGHSLELDWEGLSNCHSSFSREIRNMDERDQCPENTYSSGGVDNHPVVGCNVTFFWSV